MQVRVGLGSGCTVRACASSSGDISIELVDRVVGESVGAAGSVEEGAASVCAGRVSGCALAGSGDRLVVIGYLVGGTSDALQVGSVEVILGRTGGVRIGGGSNLADEEE